MYVGRRRSAPQARPPLEGRTPLGSRRRTPRWRRRPRPTLPTPGRRPRARTRSRQRAEAGCPRPARAARRRVRRRERGRRPHPRARRRAAGTSASLRACDRETASANGVKSQGTRQIAKIASEPPTTYAAQRGARRGRPGEVEQPGDRNGRCGRRAGRSEKRSGVPSSCPAYCSNRAVTRGVRAHGLRVADHGQEPGGRRAPLGRRAPPARGRRSVRPAGPTASVDGEEACERDPEEQRVRRVDDREHERRGHRRGREQRSRRVAGRLKRECERGRDEQLARAGRGAARAR